MHLVLKVSVEIFKFPNECIKYGFNTRFPLALTLFLFYRSNFMIYSCECNILLLFENILSVGPCISSYTKWIEYFSMFQLSNRHSKAHSSAAQNIYPTNAWPILISENSLPQNHCNIVSYRIKLSKCVKFFNSTGQQRQQQIPFLPTKKIFYSVGRKFINSVLNFLFKHKWKHTNTHTHACTAYAKSVNILLQNVSI